MPVSSRAWQIIAENKIKTAIDEGQFDDLPGFGKPLAPDFWAYDENWWLKAKAKRENLSVLPPALVLKREVERRMYSIQGLDDEASVRERLIALNRYIRAANLRIFWGPPSDVNEFDVEAFIADWRRQRFR